MTRPDLLTRDFRRLRKLALEIIEQVGHYERNTATGADDTIRAILVHGRTKQMDAIGRRLRRRWERALSVPGLPHTPLGERR